MRYKVRGLEVRSENAAKSVYQPARKVVDWINSHERVNRCLDYGCGKLRYAHFLLEISELLDLVDSKEQLNRHQKIGEEYISVENFVKKYWPSARAITVPEFNKQDKKYDIILCANVLSAIPSRRTFNNTIKILSKCLTHNGEALFVTQYTNSFFSKIKTNPKARRHFHGWLVDSLNGPSYYGLINRPKLCSALEANGFQVKKSWTAGQSAFALCK